eukprot:6864439-Pyramimonas_sp.AAC.1
MSTRPPRGSRAAAAGPASRSQVTPRAPPQRTPSPRRQTCRLSASRAHNLAQAAPPSDGDQAVNQDREEAEEE